MATELRSEILVYGSFCRTVIVNIYRSACTTNLVVFALVLAFANLPGVRGLCDIVIEPGCISTGDSVNVTCTCQLEACTGENSIQVMKTDGSGSVDLAGNVLNYDEDPCYIMYTFQANSTDDDGAEFSCWVIFANKSVAKFEPITLNMSVLQFDDPCTATSDSVSEGADTFLSCKVNGVIADCIDKQTVQLHAGEDLLVSDTLGSLLRLNNSTFELCFARPSSQNCTIKVSLVDGNGNVADISYVHCPSSVGSSQSTGPPGPSSSISGSSEIPLIASSTVSSQSTGPPGPITNSSSSAGDSAGGGSVLHIIIGCVLLCLCCMYYTGRRW